MKNLKSVLVIIITLALILWFISNQSRSKLTEQTNNTYIKANDAKKIDTLDLAQKNQKKLDQLFEEPIIQETLQKEKKKKPSSFLAAFRDFQFFLSCRDVLDKISDDRDPMEAFSHKIANSQRFELGGDEEHLQYYEKYIDKCHNLLESDNESYADASLRLQQVYLAIEPKTEEEKDLSQYLIELEQIKEAKLHLKEVNSGKTTLPKLEHQRLQEEIDHLSQESERLYDEHHENLPQEVSAQIKSNQSRIRQIYNLFKNNKVLDKEAIKNANHQLNELKNNLFETIKYNVSPDALLHLFYFNFKDRNFFPELHRETGGFTSEMINSIFEDIEIQPHSSTIFSRNTFPLFACSINYPCDSDSLIIWDLCIYRGIKEACGTDVESYFLNHHISSNLQPDVNLVLLYLLENYAQKK